MDKATDMPTLADKICEFCRSNTEPKIQQTPAMIQLCCDVGAQLPDQYRWRFTSDEVLVKMWGAARSASEANTIYWKDQLSSVEAYSVTFYWRGMELLKAAIRELNTGELVAATVLTRALLELACSYLVHADTFAKLCKELSFPAREPVVSKDWEKVATKMLWGTRIGEPPEHVKQTNVLSFIKRVNKTEAGAGISEIYDYLCDVAHPSFVGNARFWSKVESVKPDESEIRLLEQRSEGESAAFIKGKSLHAISLSALCMTRAFALIRESIKELLTKLEQQVPE
jgi:hypothetical protein